MNALRNRRGAVAAMSAVVMVGVIGFAGLAIDLTRIWMVNARLKTAIDAASLVAARTISADATQRDALVRNVYWANYTQNGRNTNYLLATAQQPTITQLDVDRIQVTGTAVVPTTLFSIIDRRNTTISDSAIARRQVTGLELALVLDVTGSMASNNNIATLRTAAENLVDTVFANQIPARPTVWVSVVPYTAMVNIGRDRTNWLVPNSLDTNAFLPTVWRGCVEARAGTSGTHTYRAGADQDDGPPSQDPFQPHFYPSNRYDFSFERDAGGQLVLAPNGAPYIWVYRAPGNTRTRVYAGGVAPEDLRSTDIPVNRGDNAWIPGAGGTVVSAWNPTPAWNTAVWEPDPETPDADQPAGGDDNQRRGPNLGCGRAVLPLTSNKQAVVDQIRALRAIRRGGTMANTGLQLGWGTISPRWRADWNLNEFRENDPNQRLPLAYNTTAMSKAIVLMTDGENQWYDWPGGAPGACGNGVQQCTPATPAPPAGVPIYTANVDGDQNAYGRLSTNRLGVANATGGPSGTAATNVPNGINARMTALCQAVQARDPPVTGRPRNITVYTIVFVANPSVAVENLYRSCASRPENYFLAQNQAQLLLAFSTIAGQLASLRLLE